MYKIGKFKVLALALMMLFASIVWIEGVQAEEVVLKLAHGNSADHPMNKGAEKFASLVAEGTPE